MRMKLPINAVRISKPVAIFSDTSATYGDGDSERVIGGLIGTLFKREDVVIASKAGVTYPEGNRIINNSRAALIAEPDKTLNRLETDYLDLWQIHSWDPNNPLKTLSRLLDCAYSSGKARYVGVCNFFWMADSSCGYLARIQLSKKPNNIHSD
jgi:aryl-alcohol dehydrogenase-like predicted oxidoreductase